MADETDVQGEPPEAEKKHRSPWIWVSAVLAVAAVGLLVWALGERSASDDAEKKAEAAQVQLASTQKELDDTEQDLKQYEADVNEKDKSRRRAVFTVATFATMKKLYNDLSGELGATQEDLATAQEDIDAADAKAKEADQKAEAAAEEAAKADDETDKAKAEAEQAAAEADAAQSRSEIAVECARAYVAAFGILFEGDDPSAQVPKVREQITGITEKCQAALADA